jgi:hypothetical protein
MHRQMNFFLSTLDEYQRRLYVGLESKKLGHGGDQQLSVITYMRVDTIAKGRHELEQAGPTDRIRAPGGRRCRSKKALALLMALERLLPGATAGDPCSLLKRKHTRACVG